MQTEVGTDDFGAVLRRNLGDHFVKRRGDLGDRLVPQGVDDTARQLWKRYGLEQMSQLRELKRRGHGGLAGLVRLWSPIRAQ